MDLDDELRWQAWSPLLMGARLAVLGALVVDQYPALTRRDASPRDRAAWLGRLEAFELLVWGRRLGGRDAALNLFAGVGLARRAGIVAELVREYACAGALAHYGESVAVLDRDALGVVEGMFLAPVRDSDPLVFRPYLVLRFAAGALEPIPLGQVRKVA